MQLHADKFGNCLLSIGFSLIDATHSAEGSFWQQSCTCSRDDYVHFSVPISCVVCLTQLLYNWRLLF